MKKAPMMNKNLSKNKKKKLTSKQLIIALGKLIAKDAEKAKLPAAKEKKIVAQLGKVLEQVDAYLVAVPECFCVYDGSAAWMSTANCRLLGGTCE